MGVVLVLCRLLVILYSRQSKGIIKYSNTLMEVGKHKYHITGSNNETNKNIKIKRTNNKLTRQTSFNL